MSSKGIYLVKFIVGACLVLSLTAGCSPHRGLDVRTGPQPVHPSEYVNGSRSVVAAPVAVQTVSTRAPIRTIATAVHSPVVSAGTCGAATYQYLVGGPSPAVLSLNIPGDSRHYGPTEPTATNTPTRLNFVHSENAASAIISDRSTVLRVFCG